MRCPVPIIVHGAAVPCGQCLSCRVNKRRIWTHRLLLEAASAAAQSFVTLTYQDEMEVFSIGSRLPTLVPQHLQGFLKRLRARVDPARIRFYGVGEYGESSARPHYHLVLFGYPNCERGVTFGDGSACCVHCELIHSVWGAGRIQVAEFNQSTAQYVAGYVLKKMGRGHVELRGRYPEFSRMSLRPAIGSGLLWDISSTLLEHDREQTDVDVPNGLRHGRKVLPLGRYLRGKLREQIGRVKTAPQEVYSEAQAEVLALYGAAAASGVSVRTALRDRLAGQAASVQAQFVKRKGSL